MPRYNKNSPKWTSWCTPQYIIDAIEKAIGPIYLDPCACKDRPSGLIGRSVNWFGSGPIDDNGLVQSWDYYIGDVLQLVFVNPPYGTELKEWCKKAAYEARLYGGPILLLCPPRMGSQWWHREVLLSQDLSGIFFFDGRLQFENPPPPEEGKEQKKDQNDSDSCLIAYNIVDEKMLALETSLGGIYMKRVK